MKMTIKEETWPYIDEFLRKTPEATDKLAYFREALEANLQEGQRRTLLRLLEHKFGPVPAALRQTLAATTDSEQLDRWTDQILDAPSLAELPFFRSETE